MPVKRRQDGQAGLWNAAAAALNSYLLPYDYTPKQEGKKYKRAGLCWACPLGTGTLPGDSDLCLPLPGYCRPMALPERMPIPSLGKDLYITLREPRPIFVSSSNQRRRQRRLLSLTTKSITIDARRLSGSPQQEVATTIITMACPVGYYKEGRGASNCKSCPAGTAPPPVSGSGEVLSTSLCFNSYTK